MTDFESNYNGYDDYEDDFDASDFVKPGVVLVIVYVVLMIGFGIDRACLQAWHQRRREELIKLEETARQEALENKDDDLVCFNSISFGKSMKNTEPYYIFVWLAILIFAIDLILWEEAFRSQDTIGSTIGADIALGMAVGMFFHVVLMPCVILAKICDWRPSKVWDCCKDEPRKPLDNDGPQFRIFSKRLEKNTKKFFTYFGFLLVFLEKLLDRLAGFIDIRIFWIPSPLLRYAELRSYVTTMRVDHRCVRLDIDYGDTYLRFCYERLLNALSLTLWDKLMGKKYSKWIDSHMRFIGKPPEGGVNQFYYYQADAPCKTKVIAYPLFLCCPICASYKLTKAKTEKMVLGGERLKFKESFGMVAWTSLCLRNVCGLTQGCKDKMDQALDEQLVFDCYVSEKEMAEMCTGVDGDIYMGYVAEDEESGLQEPSTTGNDKDDGE